MPTKTDANAVLSVSELNRKTRDLLESHFGLVGVEGEISNLHRHASSGHWYFSLKDENAQIRCAMFRNRNQRCRFQPKNGDKVRVRGQLSLYAARGEFQLVVEHLEDAGAGDLQAAFEALKAKLAAERLFAQEYKQPLPAFARHVAIVTSPSGAAIADMLTVFARRCPGTRLTLVPVAVQGESAAAQIAGAIERINRWHDQGNHVEAIICGRGGGSQEDLWAFNEEVVARAIAGSSLPVVSAVGHETDFSIADMVADVRAPTPSAAAELLSADSEKLLADLVGLQQLFEQLIQRTLASHQQRVHHLRQRLRHPGRRISDAWQRCDDLERRLHQAMQRGIARAATGLNHQQQRLRLQSPGQRIAQLRETLKLQHALLVRRIHQVIEAAHTRHRHQAQLLHSLSPLNTLDRGYAIVSNDAGDILTDAGTTQAGGKIIARLGKGRLHCTVDEVLADER